MKTMEILEREARERSTIRFAERKETGDASFSVRSKACRLYEEAGQAALANVLHEALSTADSALAAVDSAMGTLEHLRLELHRIARGECRNQVERPPQTDDLARTLGQLNALIEVREMLVRQHAEKQARVRNAAEAYYGSPSKKEAK